MLHGKHTSAVPYFLKTIACVALMFNKRQFIALHHKEVRNQCLTSNQVLQINNNIYKYINMFK